MPAPRSPTYRGRSSASTWHTGTHEKSSQESSQESSELGYGLARRSRPSDSEPPRTTLEYSGFGPRFATHCHGIVRPLRHWLRHVAVVSRWSLSYTEGVVGRMFAPTRLVLTRCPASAVDVAAVAAVPSLVSASGPILKRFVRAAQANEAFTTNHDSGAAWAADQMVGQVRESL